MPKLKLDTIEIYYELHGRGKPLVYNCWLHL